ncbi:protein of unknown function [Pararobbsia alpina]
MFAFVCRQSDGCGTGVIQCLHDASLRYTGHFNVALGHRGGRYFTKSVESAHDCMFLSWLRSAWGPRDPFVLTMLRSK